MTDGAGGPPGDDAVPGKREVRILESRTGYQGFFRFEVVTLEHRRFDGRMSPPMTREILHIPSAAAVLPYDPVRDRVVLIEQFRAGCLRHAEGAWLLEVPAGLVDPGETPEATARRELVEEAGVAARRLEPIATYVPSPGAVAERASVFIAEIDSGRAGGVHGLPNEAEDIKSHVLDAATAFAWVEDGRIVAANAVVPLRWLQVHHAALRRRWLAEPVESA